MEYVNLGSSGLKVSRICLGTLTFGDPGWRSYILDEDHSRPIIIRAIEQGINFFDTADMYSLGESEKVIGRIFKDVVRREDIVIASKVFFPMSDDPNDRGLSRKHIFRSVHRSLRRLDTDYIDLYQIHRWDDETPIEETLSALNDLISMGKIRYLGASSMYAWQFAKAQYTADLFGWPRFISMQNHYNLIYREEEREMIPFCQAEGVGILPWSPLARGFLAGNRPRKGEGETKRSKDDALAAHLYYRDSDYDVLEQLMEIANQRKVTTIQLALAWLLNKPYVTAPIVGVRNVVQLDQLLEALKIKLDDDELISLEKRYQAHPILGH
ncbi:MAG: aldo/keto reductase [Anaerolineae bacterium]|nr:MAG: aldo/keto reductase [Anaerolineae bacterium]